MPGLFTFVSVSWEFASDYSGYINIGNKSNCDYGKSYYARKTCSLGLFKMVKIDILSVWDGVRCLIYLFCIFLLDNR